MKDVFDKFGIKDDPIDKQAQFDIEEVDTRLYPISGGLAQSSLVKNLLAEDEMEVVSGWKNCEEALKRFEENDRIRLLDILFCEGGCINGPGIDSPLETDQRREKVIEFWRKGTDLKNINFIGKIKQMLRGLKKSNI